MDCLRLNGCDITYLGKNPALPIKVKAGAGLKGGEMTLRAVTSSQYVSSVLISAPYAQNPVTLDLTGGKVSPTYIVITTEIMKDFGIDTEAPSDLQVISSLFFLNMQ